MICTHEKKKKENYAAAEQYLSDRFVGWSVGRSVGRSVSLATDLCCC